MSQLEDVYTGGYPHSEERGILDRSLRNEERYVT